jgi:hypothetical protein
MYNAKNFTDVFAFGSPKMYKQFIGYWAFLDNFSRANAYVHPEQSLEWYHQALSIPYECITTTVLPLTDEGEYKLRQRVI